LESYFGNIVTGIGYLLIGFTKVFFVLSIVIAVTWLLVNKIIPWADKKWPEPVPQPKLGSQKSEVSKEIGLVVSEAISRATSGKGVVVDIREV
jgi:Na+-transporting methylmalonyl-CoA/oxaloacetate decarboxylase gamma subunit